MKKLIISLFAFVAVLSCSSDKTDLEVRGLTPVYLSPEEMTRIELEDTRDIINPGKIVYRPPHIFLVEKWKGVHVIDNSNPESPVFSAFIAIPGAVDIAVKGNILYADNYRDLVSVDLGDLSTITVMDRVKNVFPAKEDMELPEDYAGYFECPDRTKGIVVGWESKVLTNPKCKQ